MGGFGSPRDHEPAWIEAWTKNTRQGKDSLDWFFRAFNATGIYEVFLKSSPRFYGFMVAGGIFGSYYWSRMSITSGTASTRASCMHTTHMSIHQKRTTNEVVSLDLAGSRL